MTRDKRAADRGLQPIAQREAYPGPLKQAEETLLHQRGQGGGSRAAGVNEAVGIALSGGGIRSATLSLGAFQGLAKADRANGGLLRHVGFLSTVSGGGYFGSFFGRMFGRPRLPGDKPPPPDQPGETADRVRLGRVVGELADPNSRCVGYLRENGRYLAPNGFGDILVATAIVLRNWFSVSAVMVLGLLAVMFGLNLFRWAVDAVLPVELYQGSWLPGLGPLDLSPYAAIPVAALLLATIPLGWVYWLVPYGQKWTEAFLRWAQVALLAAAAVALWFAPDWTFRTAGRIAAAILLLIAISTAICFTLGMEVARRRTDSEATELPAGTDAPGPRDRKIANARNLVSDWLKTSLVIVAATLLVALLDTVGQRLYAATLSAGGILGALGSWVAALGAAVAYSRKLTAKFAGAPGGGRPSIPRSVLYYAIAFALLGVGLVLLSAFAHGVTWLWNDPAAWQLVTSDPKRITTGEEMGLVLGGAFGLTFLGALVVAHVWPFVNRSTVHAFYEARLRRAYMGASNPDRSLPSLNHPADGIALREYHPEQFGGPLHLINVTVNETIDGRSQVQQRDRKGMGMAIGPAGVSLGVRHHARWPVPAGSPIAGASPTGRPRPPTAKGPAGQPAPPPDAGQLLSTGFHVFPPGVEIHPETLDLGQWTAISGAAFSTGIGSRTSLALSLLAGLFNVRLGYWWDSGVDPRKRWPDGQPGRRAGKKMGSRFASWAPVYASLSDEWLARFHGVARRRWYLSDGGHFENLGAYELVRRRLPFIVVWDNEQDADYTFPGLSNLVRKARTDFDTEIEFLSEDQLDGVLGEDTPLRCYFGTLEQLRRGDWRQEPVRDSRTRELRVRFEGTDTQRLSLAHAALAAVTYGAGDPEPEIGGVLLYIKPTLIGDEPADLTKYHSDHPAFPHESTGDQFFDEAQWESYRRLGEHIAQVVFSESPGLYWSPIDALAEPRKTLDRFARLMA